MLVGTLAIELHSQPQGSLFYRGSRVRGGGFKAATVLLLAWFKYIYIYVCIFTYIHVCIYMHTYIKQTSRTAIYHLGVQT